MQHLFGSKAADNILNQYFEQSKAADAGGGALIINMYT